MSRTVDIDADEKLCVDISNSQKADDYGYVSVYLQVKKLDGQRYLEVYTNSRVTLIELEDT